jgi:hypothetical protein
MAKRGIVPVNEAGAMLKIVFIALFFSDDISYVVEEVKRRKELSCWMKNFEKRVKYLGMVTSYTGKAWGEVGMGKAVHREGGHKHNIVDIILNWNDICSTADIPRLGEIMELLEFVCICRTLTLLARVELQNVHN